jgi:hypothetical protein
MGSMQIDHGEKTGGNYTDQSRFMQNENQNGMSVDQMTLLSDGYGTASLARLEHGGPIPDM